MTTWILTQTITMTCHLHHRHLIILYCHLNRDHNFFPPPQPPPASPLPPPSLFNHFPLFPTKNNKTTQPSATRFREQVMIKTKQPKTEQEKTIEGHWHVNLWDTWTVKYSTRWPSIKCFQQMLRIFYRVIM